MRHHLAGYDYLFEPGAPDTPTLVLLHGTGDDAASFLELGRMIAPGCTLVSVQGNVDENGMARFFRRVAMGVYDMADLEARTEGFAAFVAELVRTRRLVAERLVGVGYSNGANLLANLLFTRPEVLPRLALLHPLIPFEPDDAELFEARVLVTAGRRDAMAPAAMTERLVALLRARGAEVELVVHDGGHELVEREIKAVRAFVAGA